ncbi:MAG: hypothetical protein KF688_10515 [Pirellulales bacterium]|nr:hypothetical protein [Pirellulales bacterium]
MHVPRCAAWLLAWATVLSIGCSKGPEMAPATGTVSFRGEPLKFGTVMFQHKAGGQPAVGAIQSDGSFSLSTPRLGEGVRVGPQLVRITCFEGNDPNNPMTLPNGEPILGRSLIPQRYGSFGGSGLSVEVASGQSQPFDFQLTN